MFKKAERKQAKLKLALTGPSGSGKTYSALLLAKGIGGKIAVVDTENSSASLYSDKFDFDTCEISPPYTTAKYEQAIKAAEDAGYDVVVIDSITHQWSGEGGIIDRKAKLDATGTNSFTNWNKLTPEQERFKSIIQHAEIHMVCTMRSKQEYVLEKNDKGKEVPKKVGMAPIQRDGMEYEFTTVFDLANSHYATVSKDRSGLFDGEVFIPTEETGKKLHEWLMSGKPVVRRPNAVQLKALFDLVKTRKWGNDNFKLYMIAAFKVDSTDQLTKEDYENLSKVVSTKTFDEAIAEFRKEAPKPETLSQSEPAVATEKKWDEGLESTLPMK